MSSRATIARQTTGRSIRVRRSNPVNAVQSIILSDDLAPDNLATMTAPETGVYSDVLGSVKVVSQVILAESAEASSSRVLVGATVGDGFEILTSVGAVPDGAIAVSSLDFCMKDDLSTMYSLVMLQTQWELRKTGVVLATYVAAPILGNAVKLKVIEDGDIEVWIQGVKRLSNWETSLRAQSYLAIGVGGVSGWGVDPVAGSLIVQTL